MDAMGTDIHVVIERRNKTYKDRWVKFEDSEIPEDIDLDLEHRNYMLFSIFAGVRNFRNGVTPISEPKGIPEDSSKEYKRLTRNYGEDGHSHSYLTVREILDYEHWSNVDLIRSTLHFTSTWLPGICSLGKPEDMRICFFFDS